MQILVVYNELSMLFFSWTLNDLRVAYEVYLHSLLHLWSFTVDSTDNNEKKWILELPSPVFLEWENKMYCLIYFLTPSFTSNFTVFNINNTYMTSH